MHEAGWRSTFTTPVIVGLLISILPASSWSEAPEPEPGNAAIFWVEETLVLASPKGKAVTLEPGLYHIEKSEAAALHVRAEGARAPTVIPAKRVAADEADRPGEVRLVPSEAGTLLRHMRADGTVLETRLAGEQVRTRSIWIPLWPDLRATVSLPEYVHWEGDFSARVTLHNDGRGPASGIPFRMHELGHRSGTWATYRSDSSRYVNCSQGADGVVDCTYTGTIEAGRSASFDLRLRGIDARDIGNRGVQVHADCSPAAWHSQGGVIRELNESNNISAEAQAWVTRKPNLVPSISSPIRVDYKYQVPKNEITALSLKVTNTNQAIRYDLRGVEIVGSFANFNIHRVDAADNFSCSFSNTTHKVTCTGTLPGSTWVATMKVHVMPTAAAPIAPTPVISIVDPDGTIDEETETDNMTTTNLYITP